MPVTLKLVSASEDKDNKSKVQVKGDITVTRLSHNLHAGTNAKSAIDAGFLVLINMSVKIAHSGHYTVIQAEFVMSVQIRTLPAV